VASPSSSARIALKTTKGPSMAPARAVWLGTVATLANERLVGGIALVAGAMLFYIAMLDQGQIADVLLASGLASANHLHEFFHDGRHLGGVPCH
jgi:Probable cobalt transporter subunit (CbtB)